MNTISRQFTSATAALFAIAFLLIASTSIASADDRQEMGYFVPGQHDAMGQPKGGQPKGAVEFNRASDAQTAAYQQFFQENQEGI